VIIHNELGDAFAMDQGTFTMIWGTFTDELGDVTLLKARPDAGFRLPPVVIR